ncbi:MAG: M23 family metallopeptidase [Bacteroidota bacterium]
MSNKLKLSILACCSMVICGGLILSFTPTDDEPYQFPFDSYKTLAGTFGELRGNHFHSGIDVKTYQKIGIPTKAITNGYIYRIKSSPFGFGRAIYLKHDDGNFSVYAHLDRFTDPIEKLVFDRQVQEEKYEQEIYLAKDHIRVKRGEVIGFSGNSGSSSGPHLHFEIRDKDERILNPLAFYPNYIPDHVRPSVQEIGFEPLQIDSRVEGKWDKLRLTPTNKGNGQYEIGDVIRVKGPIGIEYKAFDRLDGASNKCGINYVKLFLDNQLIHEFRLDTFAFDESRKINMHIDYAYFRQLKRRIQRAYVLPGNDFSAYQDNIEKGIIELKDDDLHAFRLELTDYAGNQSIVKGKLKRDSQIIAFPTSPRYYSDPQLTSEEKHQILKITANRPRSSYREGLRIINDLGEESRLMPSYHMGSKMVFLLALDRYNYPVAVIDPEGKNQLNFSYMEEIFPDQNNLVELDELQVFFPYKALFSHQHIQVRKFDREPGMYSHVFEVGNNYIPVNEPYLINFRVGKEVDLKRMVVATKGRTKWEYAGSVIGSSHNVYASLRSFGKFCLMRDVVKPSIEHINFKNKGFISQSQKHLILRIDDNFSGIDHESIRGTLDGKWVPFEYYFRQKRIRYDFTGKRPSKGAHTLEVRVKDKAGNEFIRVYTLNF